MDRNSRILVNNYKEWRLFFCNLIFNYLTNLFCYRYFNLSPKPPCLDGASQQRQGRIRRLSLELQLGHPDEMFELNIKLPIDKARIIGPAV
mgnify:CR=1 FL=1